MKDAFEAPMRAAESFQGTEIPVSGRDGAREEAIRAIRSNYNVTIFFLLPAVDSRKQFLKANGHRIGLNDEEIDFYSDLFLRAGLWSLTDHVLKTEFDLLDVGEMSVQEYLDATLNIISRLSTDGPCVYEANSLATTRELAKEFIQNINKSFRQFYEKSNASEKSILFSWAHAGLVVHENKRKTQSLL